jgi:predicted RNA binding protein YcfA (HicA-like mRNA interferase family)
MSKLPRVNGKQLIKMLSKFGFEVTRIKGSHHILKHKDGRMTVIPVHSNEMIGLGLLTKILSDCEIKKVDFTQSK